MNVGPLTHFASAAGPQPLTLHDAGGWLQLLVQQRFFPLFSLLFGIGFSLLFQSAARRGARPRVVLARRLLVLLPLGAVHQWLQPGEALLPYAVVGLLVLLPSSWLPTRLLAVLAALAVPAALATGGGLVLIPALFLVGSALVRCGAIARLESSPRAVAVLLALSAAVAVPTVLAQASDLAASGFSIVSALAGLALAGVYASTVLLALRTRLRRPLVAVFAPLGRMALTNYVSATLLLLAAGHLLNLPASRSWNEMLGATVFVLVLQLLWSALWLRRFRQGPLEHLWRWATWGTRGVVTTTR
ncbi:DUF418 domain-containing protein [Kineococcus radiotolerans]|uniref:DUF418 domain-containing protein n=1 Tax=Kineococcus radiotolerans TaxID=131568 RepID=UPI00003A3B1D|nr:DUF418 domain-containing protein [Kineococcus radiotolerans]